MDKTGDLPRDFDQWSAEESAHSGRPAQSPVAPGPVPLFQEREGSTLKSGGKVLSGTAKRSGSTLSGAQSGSHRLEVVHSADPGGPWEHSGQPPPEDDLAARMMQEIEDAVEEIRRHAAGRLISLARPSEQPHPSRQEDRVLQARSQESGGSLSRFLSRIQLLAGRLGAGRPLKSVAAILAVGFALGAALRLLRFHR